MPVSNILSAEGLARAKLFGNVSNMARRSALTREDGMKIMPSQTVNTVLLNVLAALGASDVWAQSPKNQGPSDLFSNDAFVLLGIVGAVLLVWMFSRRRDKRAPHESAPQRRSTHAETATESECPDCSGFPPAFSHGVVRQVINGQTVNKCGTCNRVVPWFDK